jgi:hypothetical protein
MFNIRWPRILGIAIVIISTVVILSAAYDPMPADGQPHVRMTVDPWSGQTATFQTNFRLYAQGEKWPYAIQKELLQIEGVKGLTMAGVGDPFTIGIAIGELFTSKGIPEKAKKVILSFAPKQK